MHFTHGALVVVLDRRLHRAVGESGFGDDVRHFRAVSTVQFVFIGSVKVSHMEKVIGHRVHAEQCQQSMS